jgi:hypothetical protein
MKTQLQTILNFSQFYSLTTSQKLPIKVAYKLSRLATAIESEVTFYQTKFREILNEYCLVDDNGNYVPTDDGQGFKIQPGKEIECNQAMADLHSLEIELPDITFNIDEFDGLELRIQDLNGIMPFIVD